MNTCVKRSVLGAGDRAAELKRAAAVVQTAVQQLQQRVQPHAGSPLGGPRRGVGAAIPHGGYGNYDPIAGALRGLGNAISGFARAVDNALNTPVEVPEQVSANGQVALRIVYQPYVEPMLIPWPSELSVATVLCGRAVDTANPSLRLLNGSEVDFDFAYPNLRVNSIDGMTPDPTRMITWTFLYFGIS